MIRRRGLKAFTIVGLAILCLGLGANAIMSGSRLAGGDDLRRLAISSIDLSTGTRDAILSARGMVPGDAVTAAVTVANSGRQPMAYAMSHGLVSAHGAALSAALVLTIKTIGSSCADDNGTTLFDGPLDEAAFGTEGNRRPLPAATAEILCFRVALPADADDGLQGGATTVPLSFGASSQAAIP